MLGLGGRSHVLALFMHLLFGEAVTLGRVGEFRLIHAAWASWKGDGAGCH